MNRLGILLEGEQVIRYQTSKDNASDAFDEFIEAMVKAGVDVHRLSLRAVVLYDSNEHIVSKDRILLPANNMEEKYEKTEDRNK